ncbi:hypothetical protein Pmani_023066 [Petrolisthes manimaculis]|uniref:Uncharacterized protein n=1 Tax=Petrolisthes manimaculis TaxID=1843537 RepID=A0AAE1PCP6_9EUCA|nr:hypothetical protein Pmani_023066 [Petrolisthes manimaculis]
MASVWLTSSRDRWVCQGNKDFFHHSAAPFRHPLQFTHTLTSGRTTETRYLLSEISVLQETYEPSLLTIVFIHPSIYSSSTGIKSYWLL